MRYAVITRINDVLNVEWFWHVDDAYYTVERVQKEGGQAVLVAASEVEGLVERLKERR